MMRISLDTNFLSYAEGYDDEERARIARQTLAGIAPYDLVMPVQVSAELTRMTMRKFRMPPDRALTIVARYQTICAFRPATTEATFDMASLLVDGHQFQIFDAIIMAASVEAGARMLLTEDMQDGFVWRGCTVVNPFAPTPHPLLADLLR